MKTPKKYTMQRNTFSCLLLIIAIYLAASVPLVAQEESPTVKVVGEMRKVMWEGKLGGVIKLDTISSKENVYGLGPVEFLTGEILIIDRSFYRYLWFYDESGRIRVSKSIIFCLRSYLRIERSLHAGHDKNDKAIGRLFGCANSSITSALHV